MSPVGIPEKPTEQGSPNSNRVPQLQAAAGAQHGQRERSRPTNSMLTLPGFQETGISTSPGYRLLFLALFGRLAVIGGF